MDTVSIPSWAVSIVGLLTAATIGVVGALLKRAITGVDGTLKSLDSKVDLLAKTAAAHDVRLATFEVRLGAAERKQEQMDARHADFGGFLASMGYRKREG